MPEGIKYLYYLNNYPECVFSKDSNGKQIPSFQKSGKNIKKKTDF